MTTSQHVFISYQSLEAGFALRLAGELRKAGVKVWVDRQHGGIGPGDDWPRTLEEAINTCRAFIAVVSPDYVLSTVSRQELNRAFKLAKPIFPVLLQPVKEEDWPLEIQRLQYVIFADWRRDRSFRKAIDSLLARLQSDAADVIGQRPDPEQQHLYALVAELEASGGIAKHIELAAELRRRRG